MRAVICHYHIFKNSGTSFDQLLKKNFGDKHRSFDGGFPFFIYTRDQLAKIVSIKTEYLSFSSHQLRLPAPESNRFKILPVIFVRHPILRVRSIYSYKRKIKPDGTLFSETAKKYAFDEWLAFCLETPKLRMHITNSQTRIIAGGYEEGRLKPTRDGKQILYDINIAKGNLDNIDFLARTEFYNEDVSRFPKIAQQHGIDFEYHPMPPQNTSSDDLNLTTDQRLESIRKQLGDDAYQILLGLNSQDMQLFNYACERLTA